MPLFPLPAALRASFPFPPAGEGGRARRTRSGQGRGVLLAALLALSACGLKPLYAGGGSGVAAETLAGVEVAPIADESGFLLRQELQRRFNGGGSPRYRLEIALDDQILGFGIRGDAARTRERRTLRARYRLVDIGTNAVLIDATAGSDTSIDVVQSEFAVVAAENTALERLAGELADQITLRLAVFARSEAARTPS